jgi:methyltransferase (TIGR00027 family)
MQLRIGQLAKRVGLTVRTLHHYDAIGLLSPSVRSGSGFRLYDQADVMRLHKVVALKGFGCSLAEIRDVLDGGEVTLPDILARQIEVLDAKARQARSLRDRLSRLRARMLRNEATGMTDWLETLEKMHMYEQYFSGEELAVLRVRLWGEDRRLRQEWASLVAAVREAMDRGTPPDSKTARELLRSAARLAREMTGNDPALAGKLRAMLMREERARAAAGVTPEVLSWIDRAIEAVRLAAVAARQDHRAGVGNRAVGAPSDSALSVASLRAAHQLLDAPPVFEDPLALRILGPRKEAAIRENLSRYDAGRLRGLRASVAVRSRAAEDAWAEARERGVRQYVILGAGLDTFAYRTPDRESRIFEVDLPQTQAVKRKLLREAGIEEPPTLSFAPMDFEAGHRHGGLVEALAGAGFSREIPAFFAWLGVTMYLTEATVLGTLGTLAALPPGSGVVFDYPVLPELLSPREREGREDVMARTAAKGEPWKSAFDPAALVAALEIMGFGLVTDLDARALGERYLAGRTDGLRKSGVTRILVATIPAA